MQPFPQEYKKLFRCNFGEKAIIKLLEYEKEDNEVLTHRFLGPWKLIQAENWYIYIYIKILVILFTET
jgi:hypothetical protein